MAEGDFPKSNGDAWYGDEATGACEVISVLAGENLTAGNAVYINLSDGKAYIADTGTAADIRFSGFVLYTVTSGNTAVVQCAGTCTKLSGLTSGARYFLGAAGAISTTKNNIPVGIATSTTKLQIRRDGLFPSDLPIGSVIAWAKSFTGVPSGLPAGWVECNGQVLSDGESLLDAQTIPNLNASGGGTKRFLRGSTTSGTTGGADTADPRQAEGDVTSATIQGRYAASSISILPSYYEVVWVMKIK